MGWAQAGTWVLDGWPDQRSGYFAGRTEIYADGDRLKITEWPENTEDDTQTLETYFLGQTVVKVFPWNGSRVGWCLRRLNRFPRRTQLRRQARVASALSPFAFQEGEIPCGEVHLPRPKRGVPAHR